MPRNKSYADLRMDKTRLPRDATAVTVTQAQALKDGEVLADDGNSYSTVQGAQDAASSWIRLPPETFNEAVTIDTTGLSVIGSGYDTRIDGGTISNAININADDVTVYNLTARTSPGNGNAYDGIFNNQNSNLIISNCTVPASDHFGITIDSSAGSGSNNKVENCTVQGNVDEVGIRVQTERSTVISCTTTNTGSQGILVDGDDCVVASNTVEGAGVHGIDLRQPDIVVYSNRIISSANDGLVMNQDTVDCVGVNNRISGSANLDIDDDGTNNLVQDNRTGSAN